MSSTTTQEGWTPPGMSGGRPRSKLIEGPVSSVVSSPPVALAEPGNGKQEHSVHGVFYAGSARSVG